MKNKFIAILGALLLPAVAMAYVSNQGTDPAAGNYESEYKTAQKSTTALYSDAVSRGHGLFYDENDYTGLYKVSRYDSQTQFAAASAKRHACIASKDVATGDTGYFPCVTRGYVDYARYIAGTAQGGGNVPIAAGDYLCIGTAATNKGSLLPCNANVVSPFVALEAKTSGTTGLKVLVKSD